MKTTPLALLAVASLTTLVACTSTAGPFVTNISSAGHGRIRVEKCEVEYTPWGYARIQTGECTTETLNVAE